jgi:tripartite-type tricarboxylate transporter receptor subunit TctC
MQISNLCDGRLSDWHAITHSVRHGHAVLAGEGWGGDQGVLCQSNGGKRAMLTRRRVFAASAAGFVSAASGVVPQAFAQLDRKLVRIIVGFPPGSADVIARILADRLQLPYASTVIVENKPDASGRLAVEYVKNAEPDGSVLLFTPEGPIAVFPHSFRKLNYDPLRDLTPVAPTVKTMLTFNIGPAVPQSVQSLAGFMQWCKANPDHATFAAVAGAPPHFVGFMLAKAAGVQMRLVHYRGGAPALQDLLGGHVPASTNCGVGTKSQLANRLSIVSS